MKKVTDTTKIDPALILLEAMARGGAPGMIEAQEARGQREAVNSDQLPTKGLLGADRATWEAMGIKILEPDAGTTSSKDALFTAVELPKGWKKEATDHSMWNNLVDDKGRIRATFFYKAAFYDRDAHISSSRRFTVQRNYDRKDYKEVLECQVMDAKKVVFSVEGQVPKKPDGRDDYQALETIEKGLREACCQWLVDNGFPNYNDFNAYWD